MNKFRFALTIASLAISSSHAVDVTFGFDGNVLACPGDSVTVTWAGYHNIQETLGSACDSGDFLNNQVEGFLNSGEQRTYADDELTAPPGKRRYFKCSAHCGESFNRFEVYCPAGDDESPAPTAAVVEPACFNDPTFRHNDKPKKSCVWINKKEKRIKNMCKKNTVYEACQTVCGKCCADDLTTTFEVDGQEQTCTYLSDETIKRVQCPRNQVKFACSATCGQCCSNDKDFKFNIRTQNAPKFVKCGWFKKKKRANKWCNQEPTIAEACEKSCKSCEDYTTPVTG